MRTGADYVESLRDGRGVMLDGERIDDITKHPLLADHPYALSGEIRAYAAFPLHDVGGNAVGTLSVWDTRPRRWTGGQVQILEDLSAAAHAKIFGA